MKQKISPHVAILIILGVVTGISVYEGRALYVLDHPPPHRMSCTSCHSDAKTLKAMQDKAGIDAPEVYLRYHKDVPGYFKGRLISESNKSNEVRIPVSPHHGQMK